MKKTVDSRKKRAYLLIFLCWLIYTSSYIGKLGYSANIAPIENFYGISHAEAGLVSTFFFFSYGAGQIINGIFCKKYPLKYTVPASLAVSAACNLFVSMTPDFVLVKYVWLLNGCALSTLWPSVMRFLSENLEEKFTSRAVVVMGTSVACGTFLVYGLSSLFVRFFSYRYIFYTACAELPVVALLWLFFCPGAKHAKAAPIPAAEPAVGMPQTGADADTPKAEPVADVPQTGTAVTNPKPHGNRLTGSFVCSFVFLAVFAVATNLLKDGLTTWSPSILKELYHFDDSLSILLTLFLPVFAIFGTAVAVALQKKIPDFVLLCAVLFVGATVFLCGILAGLRVSAIIILICFSVISCLMSGTNNVITSMAPLCWKEQMNSGFSAGILNGFCYIGSALSSYVLGSMADRGGWNAVFLFLLVLCVVCTAGGMVSYAIRRKTESR